MDQQIEIEKTVEKRKRLFGIRGRKVKVSFGGELELVDGLLEFMKRAKP